MITQDRVRRFWSHVQKTPTCWEWTASKRDGYGLFQSIARKSAGNAHRVAWVLAYGDIPKGSLVLHKCDNRSCVKPSHLFLGTYQDNMDDRNKKGRQARGERNAHARLTADQVTTIRLLRNDGRYIGWGKRIDIAERFGVSVHTISSIWAMRSWRHI